MFYLKINNIYISPYEVIKMYECYKLSYSLKKLLFAAEIHLYISYCDLLSACLMVYYLPRCEKYYNL